MASCSMKPTLRPDNAKQLVMNGPQRPMVIRNMIDQWPCRQWDLDQWSSQFGERAIRWRVGPMQLPCEYSTGPLWETECNYVSSTVAEFVAWQQTAAAVAGHPSDEQCPPSRQDGLANVDRSQNWTYADYKHMAELFDADHDILNCVDWGVFGFEGRRGRESTIWIGSASSHTPCHYDTYGINLVAQLIGRKRWILFPPTDADNLYPTRFPYEESSVFSQVNIQNPQNEKLAKFKLTTPYVVTLDPGDVLFVPHKWWHFVTSLSTALSINSWIEWEEDDDRRLEEAITRTMVSAFVETYSLSTLDWLNPTEAEVFPEDNIRYVKTSLERCLKTNSEVTASPPKAEEQQLVGQANADQSNEQKPREDCATDLSMPNASKRLKLHKTSQVDLILKEHSGDIRLLQPMSFQRFAGIMGFENYSSKSEIVKDRLSEEDKFQISLYNSLLDPEVISLICEKLKRTQAEDKM